MEKILVEIELCGKDKRPVFEELRGDLLKIIRNAPSCGAHDDYIIRVFRR